MYIYVRYMLSESVQGLLGAPRPWPSRRMRVPGEREDAVTNLHQVGCDAESHLLFRKIYV